MTTKRLLHGIVAVADRVAAVDERVRRWWQHWWIWVVGLPLGLWCLAVMALTWKFAGEQVEVVSDLFSQMQMLITGTQAVIAFVVGVAVMHSARTAAEANRQRIARDQSDAHHARVGRALAFAGAALDVATHGSMLSILQRSGLKRRLSSPRAEEKLRLLTFEQLIAALSAAARAVQHLRYADDELLKPAEQLFSVVLEIQTDAFAGDVQALEAKVEVLNARRKNIEALIRQMDPIRASQVAATPSG